mmetsp:Transcript_21152/g.24350  ORF Transcript_21152/g.24350 Transcript_21152/m.24350 type:complete len:92 (+) Transcript_21152:951-1226(+)
MWRAFLGWGVMINNDQGNGRTRILFWGVENLCCVHITGSTILFKPIGTTARCWRRRVPKITPPPTKVLVCHFPGTQRGKAGIHNKIPHLGV